MTHPDFLRKLHREGKLELVESSEAIAQAYREKSDSYLSSAKLLLEHNHLEESVSLAYYSIYYLVLAILFRSGIKCENHTAAILLLEELFGISTEKLRSAKKERIDKQYYVDFSITKQDVQDMMVMAETSNAELRTTLAQLSNETIRAAQQKLRQITV